MSTQSGAIPAGRGQCQAIDLAGKLELIDDRWQPRVIAEMNDYQFKVVKVEGEFVWHTHGDTDETFIVLDGELRIELRGDTAGEGSITLRAGQMAVVPKGVEHKPIALGVVQMMLIESRGVVNTGDGETGERTALNDEWL
jgi:mannose-6-phosphate isomerase-like protein (cupin superfamily)